MLRKSKSLTVRNLMTRPIRIKIERKRHAKILKRLQIGLKASQDSISMLKVYGAEKQKLIMPSCRRDFPHLGSMGWTMISSSQQICQMRKRNPLLPKKVGRIQEVHQRLRTSRISRNLRPLNLMSLDVLQLTKLVDWK